MEQHPNARLTPRGRETLVSRIESGLGVAETARQMGVSRQTASKWLRRSRSGEPMSDRSSRPRRLARSTPREIENRVREARSSLPLAPPGLAPGALCLGSGGRLRSSRGLGRGDAGGVDLAQIGELLDEGEAHRVVHLDARRARWCCSACRPWVVNTAGSKPEAIKPMPARTTPAATSPPATAR